MIASKVTREVLENAAQAIGVSLEINTLSQSGLRHRVKLLPGKTDSSQWKRPKRARCPACGVKTSPIGEAGDTPSDIRVILACGDAVSAAKWGGYRRKEGEAGDSKYQRTSANACHDERRVFAVCWHGFRDYFREVYKSTPEAIFRTAVDTWKGSEDFEARYRESGYRNVGSAYMPMSMASVCRCPGQGYAE
jgi:hypothetical protein